MVREEKVGLGILAMYVVNWPSPNLEGTLVEAGLFEIGVPCPSEYITMLLLSPIEKDWEEMSQERPFVSFCKCLIRQCSCTLVPESQCQAMNDRLDLWCSEEVDCRAPWRDFHLRHTT